MCGIRSSITKKAIYNAIEKLYGMYGESLKEPFIVKFLKDTLDVETLPLKRNDRVSFLKIREKLNEKRPWEQLGIYKGTGKKLVPGEISNDDTYTRTELKEFCTSLINGQRNDMRIMKSGSWCVAPSATNMPGDARVYLALSNPDFCPELLQILRDIKEELTDALQRGVTEGPWGEDYIKALAFVEGC